MEPEALVRIVGTLLTIGTVLSGLFLWVNRALIRAEMQPITLMLSKIEAAQHEHERRLGHVEGEVSRLRDDTFRKGEANTLIALQVQERVAIHLGGGKNRTPSAD